jgi:hypothetical protein
MSTSTFAGEGENPLTCVFADHGRITGDADLTHFWCISGSLRPQPPGEPAMGFKISHPDRSEIDLWERLYCWQL